MYLLDTDTLLWFLFENDNLSQKAQETISSNPNKIFVSHISFWEIAIKIRIGKLKYSYNTYELIKLCQHEGFDQLPVNLRHIHETSLLPLIHRDPFDRMPVAQAKVEGMTLITHDQYIPKYPIETVW